MKKKLLFLYVTFLCILSDHIDPVVSLSSESTHFIGASLKMIWGLLVVLGILLIIYGFARKKLSFVQNGKKGAIKIIETRHLMPKKSLFLIEVSGKQYLLGAGSDSINLITAIDDMKSKTSFDELLHNSEPDSYS